MVRTRALRFLLILGLVALLLPVSLAQADGHEGSGTGTAVVRDALILGDPFAGDIPVTVDSGKLTVSMTGVPEPADQTVLEGWLVSDDGQRKQSIGILEVSPDGSINHEWDSDPGENLLLGFNRFVITVEPIEDDDPEPSDELTHAGLLDADVLEQVRSLLDSTDPADLGAAVNLRSKAWMAADHARKARSAVSNEDLEGAKGHLAAMNAVINGSEEDPGIAALADEVAEAAAMAGEDASGDETVMNASEATAAAANSAKDFVAKAAASAELASAATSTAVATLEIGNVVKHAGDAADQAEMAYTGSQDMGTYNIASADAVRDLSVGEPIIGQIVRYSLIASIVLVLAGSVMFLASRRRSGVSAASTGNRTIDIRCKERVHPLDGPFLCGRWD